MRHSVNHTVRSVVFAAIALSASMLLAAPPKDAGRMPLDHIQGAKFHFKGLLGDRIQANVENWLLVTPEKNPGLLDMFANRESNSERDLWQQAGWKDPTNLVPWAGEFVGKYLISAVQAMRTSDDPRLRETAAKVVDRLLQLQAEDGYLGPWPKKEQLMSHWDLWGNYHVMFGLMLWAEQTGDQRAMQAAERIADLVCTTFSDGKHRVVDAGSSEMNMGILHGLTMLYRKTGEPRYLEMAKEVLKDFEKAGDYYRTGLAGEEYYRTPKPRWESLHSLQGLAELYWITGDPSFRRAFLAHWASMRRFDLRNTGGFSSGEQATGNPFTNSAIETCCVVAWEAVMIDALRLTADSTIADDLELATMNAIAGAQHPSGAWCTYNTPISGVRVPSHVHIAFQGRPGAEFLNCCSVNGPRGFGMMSEWAVMRNAEGLAINYYGPMRAEATLADGTPVAIEEITQYPLDGAVQVKIDPKSDKKFVLALRIPAWSKKTSVSVNGQQVASVKPGEYLKLDRVWRPGDELQIALDMDLHYEAGDLEEAGHVSLYRGPLLLCADKRFETADQGPIALAKLSEAKVTPIDASIDAAAEGYRPWIIVDVPTADGHSRRLIDFASAGASGKSYQSWLPAAGARAPRPVAWLPPDGAKLPPGPLVFAWRRPVAEALESRRHTVVISETPTFDKIVLQYGDQPGAMLSIPADVTKKLEPGKTYFWKLVVTNENGSSESIEPYKQFVIDPSAPAPLILLPRADGALTEAPLDGDVKPTYGDLASARGWQPAAGPNDRPNAAIETDGREGLITYRMMSFPNADYTAAFWLHVNQLPPAGQYGQAFSAWCRGGDDPLRIVVLDGKLSARIEGGGLFNTEGVPVDLGGWHHVAVVKNRDKLTLYIDGKPGAPLAVPLTIGTTAKDFALGGNPHFTGGPEFLAARFARLHLLERAMSPEQIQQLYQSEQAGFPTGEQK